MGSNGGLQHYYLVMSDLYDAFSVSKGARKHCEISLFLAGINVRKIVRRDHQ